MQSGVFWCSQVLGYSLLPLDFIFIWMTSRFFFKTNNSDLQSHISCCLQCNSSDRCLVASHAEHCFPSKSKFLLPLDFSLILPVASRLLQLYSTDNKTSRLMVKRFSTVRGTQRGSQSYMKKRRGRREIEMIRRRKGGTQEERDRSTQLSVP